MPSRKELFMDALTRDVNAGAGVMVVRTREPYRAFAAIQDVAVSKDYVLKEWKVSDGWRQYSNDDPDLEPEGDGDKQVMSAFDKIGQDSWPEPSLSVIHWAHEPLNNLGPLRQMMMNYAVRLPTTRKRVILLVPTASTIPDELREVMVIHDFSAPDQGELREVWDRCMQSIGDSRRRPDFSEEDVSQIVATASGLTQIEAELAFCRPLTVYKDRLPNITLGQVLEIVGTSKVEAVKRSDVLELMESGSPDDIGGLENLKDWVGQVAACMTPEARAFGIEYPKGVFLAGPPGCLSGDTPMLYKRGKRNSGRSITLEDMYRKFNGLPGSHHPQWDMGNETFLHSHDAETGAVFYNRVVSVTDAGDKPVVLLSTEGGRQLKLTADHPVLTEEDGYVPAGELTQGSRIIVRGAMVANPAPVRHGRKPRVVVEGLKYYASGWLKEVKDRTTGVVYTYQRQHRARLVMEAHMNGLTYDDYIHRLKNDPEAVNLKTVPRGFVVHHLDEDPMNDTLGNLEVLQKIEHDREHTDETNFNVEYTALDTIESVECYGVERTYDIQMERPCSNFCTADGLIVHNTGKSASAKAIASVLRLPLIKFDISRVFNSLVGKSEERIKDAMKTISSMAPCVALIDEVDKVFNVNSSGGDAGTGMRVLGTLLTGMQENDDGVFWVVTANRVDGLPPELLRKGRLDETFAVTTPNEQERLEVLRIHLRKRGKNPDDVSGLDKAAAESADFVPAELEAAVKEALKAAFVSGQALTGELILAQLSEMTPLKEAFPEQFEGMERWAANNARPASRQPAARRSRTPRARRQTPGNATRQVSLDG